jgi:hypothetical protein
MSRARTGRPRRHRPAARLIAAALVLAGAGAAAALAARARAEAEVRYFGERADDNFGFSLDAAGDVDGDGFVDLLVGAIFNDDAASAAGKTYVFPGGRGFGTLPLVAMVGEAADDHFGVAVAHAGDVNGDGFADVIVGARFNDRVASAAGAAFVFFGGPAMDGTPDVIVTGEFKDDWFGQSVDGAGDVNGDGFDDFVVGAPFNDDRGSAAGKAYLYLGGRSPSATPAVVLYGDSQDDGHFGWSVSRAGDVNGDGYDDVLVGARLFGTGTDRARGRAYVFFGGASPDGVPDVIMTGEVKDDWFGHAVGDAGDVNGDGYDDVLVGAPFYDSVTATTFSSAVGRVYVFLGGPVPDNVPDRLLTGSDPDEQLGWDLSGGADIDGDGLDDIAGGARFYDGNPTEVRAFGRVIVAYGSRGAALRPGPSLVGLTADDQFGHDVAVVPIGLNGSDSLAASAVYSDESGSGAGSAARLSLQCVGLDLAGSLIAAPACKDFESLSFYRGRVADLPAGDPGSCLARLAPQAQPLEDAATPLIGEAFFYLAEGAAGGLQGHPGFRSDGSARPFPQDCP